MFYSIDTRRGSDAAVRRIKRSETETFYKKAGNFGASCRMKRNKAEFLCPNTGNKGSSVLYSVLLVTLSLLA